MKKLRILVLCAFYQEYQYGGSATAVQNLVTFLAEKGHQVTVYTTNLHRDKLTQAGVRENQRNNIRVLRFQSRISGIYFSPGLFLKMIQTDLSDYDLVYIANCRDFVSLMGLLVPFIKNIPVLIAANGSLRAYKYVPNVKAMKRILYGMQDAFLQVVLRRVGVGLAVSNDEVRQYEMFGVPGDRIEVVPNGIDTRLFSPGESKFRGAQRLGDDFLVLYVGRLDPIKGLPVLIRAFSKFVGTRPHSKLAIVGPDFGVLSQLLAEVDALSLAESVLVLGAMSPEELVSVYRAADVLVVPSYYEVFGMAAVESMACGTPVIGTEVGGLVEIVKDGVNGLLTPPGDQVELAARLGRLASDPALLNHLKAGALRTSSRYDIEKVGLRVEAVLTSRLIKKSASKRA